MLLIFSLVIIILPISCRKIKDIFDNIWCGMIASIIMAFLTDIVTTSIKNKNDEEIYRRLSNELLEKCKDFPMELHTCVIGYRKDEKHIYDVQYTYSEWVKLLFETPSLDVALQHSEIKYLIQEITVIRNYAKEFLNISRVYYGNNNFDEEKIKKINKLINICQRIDISYHSEKIEQCKNLIANDLQKAIVALFHEAEENYVNKFNHEKFEI